MFQYLFKQTKSILDLFVKPLFLLELILHTRGKPRGDYYRLTYELENPLYRITTYKWTRRRYKATGVSGRRVLYISIVKQHTFAISRPIQVQYKCIGGQWIQGVVLYQNMSEGDLSGQRHLTNNDLQSQTAG